MTGPRDRAWTSLHRVAVPALWAAADATWAAVWIGAAANTSATFRMHLPYFAFAVPAVVAAVISGWTGRFGWHLWRRVLMLAPIVVVGAAVTAGALSEGSVDGSFWRVAIHPWTWVGSAPAT